MGHPCPVAIVRSSLGYEPLFVLNIDVYKMSCCFVMLWRSVFLVPATVAGSKPTMPRPAPRPLLEAPPFMARDHQAHIRKRCLRTSDGTTFVSTTSGLEVPVLSSLPRRNNSPLRPAILAESQPALKFRVNRPRPRSQPARAARRVCVYYCSTYYKTVRPRTCATYERLRAEASVN